MLTIIVILRNKKDFQTDLEVFLDTSRPAWVRRWSCRPATRAADQQGNVLQIEPAGGMLFRGIIRLNQKAVGTAFFKLGKVYRVLRPFRAATTF